MVNPHELLRKVEHVKIKAHIISIDHWALRLILSKYYGRKIKSIERASKKNSFFCKSWKVQFISGRPAFMKINIRSIRQNGPPESLFVHWLLFQQWIFQSKIFEIGEGILPLQPTTNGRLAILIEGSRQKLAITLTDYLEKSKNFGKNGDIPYLAKLLAQLHLKGRELLPYFRNFSAAEGYKGKVLNYGDFVRENILVDERKKIWLADWENLKIEYPESDLAWFLKDGKDAYGLPFNAPINELFLKKYQDYSGFKINRERLNKYLLSFSEL